MSKIKDWSENHPNEKLSVKTTGNPYALKSQVNVKFERERLGTSIRNWQVEDIRLDRNPLE